MKNEPVRMVGDSSGVGFVEARDVVLTKVARALGSGHRLEFVELLAQGERSIEELTELAGLAVANASQHLQHLRRAGLVASRKEGRFVFYRLADDAVVGLMGSLRAVAERNYAEAARLRERASPPSSWRWP